MPLSFFFFFFNDTATTEIYTLSLHDALPISPRAGGRDTRCDPQGGREHAARPDQRRGRGRLRHPGLADGREAVLASNSIPPHGGAGVRVGVAFDSRAETAVQ